MFKVSNKDTKTTPFACSSVSIADLEHVNPGWDKIFLKIPT